MLRKCVAGTAVAVCMVAAVDAFVQTPSTFLRSSFAKNLEKIVTVEASQRRPLFRNVRMVYTPAHSSAGLSLDELKERLDRQIAIPSPPSRESPKVGVQRSPCTSLYGNWRPTTGTEPWRSATLHTKTPPKTKAAVKDTDSVKEKRPTRGRPPVEPRPAVKAELLPDFVQRAAAVLQANKGRMDSNLFGQHWKTIHPDAPIYEYKSNKAVTIHQMLRESGDFFVVSETERQKVKMFELDEAALEKTLREWKSKAAEDLALAPTQAEASLVDTAPSSEVEDQTQVQGDFLASSESLLQPLNDESALFNDFQGAEEIALSDGRASSPSAAMQRRAVEAEVRYSEVPVHGKARMSSTDRRLRPRPAAAAKAAPVFADDDTPAAPLSTPLDALHRPAISLYNSWALDGRDFVMEVAHASAFEEAFALLAADREAKGVEFTAVDFGCGNGWAARRLAAHPLCKQAMGVDGAALMVKKAQSSDKESLAQYEIGDAHSWQPSAPADVVLAQELLYLLDDPQQAVNHLVRDCLAPGGRFIAALDCFKENKASHSWAEDLGIPMHCLPEASWRKMLKEAGLSSVEAWRTKSSGPWHGTLIVTGVRT